MKAPATPHDALFRAALQSPRSARDFLKTYLPAPLLAQCRLDTLKLESTSFVDEELHTAYGDILWSLKTTSGDGYIYVLIEHQSTPDRLIALRLMHYALSVILRHMKIPKNKNKPFPLVIPVLFYAGKHTPYPFSMDWLDGFEDPTIARELYTNPLPIVDVTIMPDEEISKHNDLALMELLLKNLACRNVNVMDLLDTLVSMLSGRYNKENDCDYLNAAFSYIVQAGNTKSKEDYRLFISTLQKKLPQYQENIMTIANQLRNEGRQEGWQEGRQTGWQEGRQDGILKTAHNMLDMGFSVEDVARATGLPKTMFSK